MALLQNAGFVTAPNDYAKKNRIKKRLAHMNGQGAK